MFYSFGVLCIIISGYIILSTDFILSPTYTLVVKMEHWLPNSCLFLQFHMRCKSFSDFSISIGFHLICLSVDGGIFLNFFFCSSAFLVSFPLSYVRCPCSLPTPLLIVRLFCRMTTDMFTVLLRHSGFHCLPLYSRPLSFSRALFFFFIIPYPFPLGYDHIITSLHFITISS